MIFSANLYVIVKLLTYYGQTDGQSGSKKQLRCLKRIHCEHGWADSIEIWEKEGNLTFFLLSSIHYSNTECFGIQRTNRLEYIYIYIFCIVKINNFWLKYLQNCDRLDFVDIYNIVFDGFFLCQFFMLKERIFLRNMI